MQATQYPFEHLMDITARPAQVFVRGEGAYLWDQHGRRYLDFVQGWAVNAFGHAPRVIADALAAQAKLLVSPSPAFHNAPSLKLAKLLCEHSHYAQVFFTSSGAEANEGAIKLARKYGKKFKGGAFEIVTLVDGFHGRTLATMSASGKPGWDTMFAPQVTGFPKARLNDLASCSRDRDGTRVLRGRRGACCAVFTLGLARRALPRRPAHQRADGSPARGGGHATGRVARRAPPAGRRARALRPCRRRARADRCRVRGRGRERPRDRR